MMRKTAIFMVIALLMASQALAVDSTTQPSAAVTAGELQIRANEDLAKNDFAGALPLLEKLSEMLASQPDQVGQIQEQIRVCRRNLEAAQNAPAPAPAPVQSVVMAVDGGVRKLHPVPVPGQVVDIQIKELGNFDYDNENGGNIPDDVKRMDGATIRTTGFMIPLDEAEKINQFALVPSLFACCFGQPPQIQHTIIVTCAKGSPVSYYPDELVVQGTLHVKEQRDGGFIVSIFQIDAQSVGPAPK